MGPIASLLDIQWFRGPVLLLRPATQRMMGQMQSTYTSFGMCHLDFIIRGVLMQYLFTSDTIFQP